jgi:hypothetical protein
MRRRHRRTGAVWIRQTLEESEWLLSLAASSKCIRGVSLSTYRKRGFREAFGEAWQLFHAKGLRHIIQAEQDEKYILRSEFNRGFCIARKFSSLSWGNILTNKRGLGALSPLPSQVQVRQSGELLIFEFDERKKWSVQRILCQRESSEKRYERGMEWRERRTIHRSRS